MQSLPPFAEHTTIAAGTRTHYIAAGAGELILLIHGSLCDHRYWRWQMGEFSEAFHVVAPSLPGCWPEPVGPAAPSDPPEDDRFSVERHVRAVIDLCSQLSPDRPVHLVGHSRGAQVALEAALAMPDRVQNLVLADPGFPFTNEPPASPVHAQIAGRLGSAPLDDVLAEFVDTVNGAGTWRRTVSWFKEMVRANAWTLVPQLRDIHRSVDPSRLAATLHCPVLLLGGEFSPARYGSRMDILQQALPQARRITIPKAAHGMNLANARAFNDAVLRFLSGRDS